MTIDTAAFIGKCVVALVLIFLIAYGIRKEIKNERSTKSL